MASHDPTKVGEILEEARRIAEVKFGSSEPFLLAIKEVLERALQATTPSEDSSSNSPGGSSLGNGKGS